MSDIRNVLLIGGPSDGERVRHDITNPVLYIHERMSFEETVSFEGERSLLPLNPTRIMYLYHRESYSAGSLGLHVYVFQSLLPEETLQKLIDNYEPCSKEDMPL